MKKDVAIRWLGGTPTLAGRAIGIASQGVTQWPDPLPPRIADRVIAALARQYVTERWLIGVAERDARKRERLAKRGK